MKKIKKLMALSMAVAICTSSSFIALASTSAEEQKVLAAASAKVPGISTFAAQGKFSDYFPNPDVAKAVAKELKKSVDDTVTLSELMSNVKNLFIGEVDRLDNIDGLEYLFSLNTLIFYNIPNGIDFKDTLNYAKNLKELYLIYVNNTTLPEGLINSGIDNYRIYFDFNIQNYGPTWNVVLPQNLIGRANTSNIRINLGGGTGLSDIGHNYEAGSPFDTYKVVDPFIQYILDIQLSQKGPQPIRFEIKKDALSWSEPILSLTYDQQKHHAISDFLGEFNQKVQKELKEVGNYFIVFNTIGIDDIYYLMPLTVTKAPLSKAIFGQTYAANGDYVGADGLIQGNFEEGVNNLSPSQIVEITKNMNIMVKNADLTDIPSHILSFSVTVKEGEIVSASIAGLAEIGNYSSFFMLTFA